MSSQLVSHSSYVAGTLSKADIYDVQYVAQQSAKVTEITKVANFEMARVGAHAIGTMAELVQGADSVRRQLLEAGHRSEIYVDSQDKVVQVTGHNMIKLTNAGQEEILKNAVYHMR